MKYSKKAVLFKYKGIIIFLSIMICVFIVVGASIISSKVPTRTFSFTIDGLGGEDFLLEKDGTVYLTMFCDILQSNTIKGKWTKKNNILSIKINQDGYNINENYIDMNDSLIKDKNGYRYIIFESRLKKLTKKRKLEL
jgi:hypothetical protein